MGGVDNLDGLGGLYFLILDIVVGGVIQNVDEVGEIDGSLVGGGD